MKSCRYGEKFLHYNTELERRILVQNYCLSFPSALYKMKTTWKEIQPVPTSQEFLDVVLSRTQRRLPTQIRAGFKINRIRGFYTRKVKFTQETFSEKLSAILDGFPRLQDIHPFRKYCLKNKSPPHACQQQLIGRLKSR